MSKNWDYGYVSDVEYVPGCYPEQLPVHLNAVCMICDVDLPVALGESFTYCELGCGRGETALMTAATAPQSQVWAFDFNPAHIAGARQLAKDAGLNNIHFEESSFQDLAEERGPQGMPQFDYITLHGVWSWINQENRKHIVRFAAKYLKPGGIVYLSYNALPGRFNADPFRKLLHILAQDEMGSTDRRALGAVKKVKDLTDIGAQYIPKEFLEKSYNSSYLSHEYLNEDWPLDYHIDVVNDLAEAKLSFLGNASIIDNFKSLFLTAEQQEALTKISPRVVETVTDYFVNRPFRRDIFVRGRRQLINRQSLGRLKNCVLQLAVKPEQFVYKIGVARGTAEINKPPYEAIVNALATGPKSIGDLMDLPSVTEMQPSAWEILGVLIGSQQAGIVIPDTSRASLEKTRLFNSIFIKTCREQGRSMANIACSVSGQVLTVNFLEMLSYEALIQGTESNASDLAKEIWRGLFSRAEHLFRDGKPLLTEAETTDFIVPELKTIVEDRIPIWRQLGAL